MGDNERIHRSSRARVIPRETLAASAAERPLIAECPPVPLIAECPPVELPAPQWNYPRAEDWEAGCSPRSRRAWRRPGQSVCAIANPRYYKPVPITSLDTEKSPRVAECACLRSTTPA